jgi:type VI secretion system secreted protein VgrG
LQSDHAKSQLNLGYLTHERSGSAEPRGNGFELRTDAAGALRAAKGVLVSAYARPNAGGNALSRDELTTLLKEALDLAKTIGDFAAKNLGNISDPKPEETLAKAVKDLGNGSNAETGANGATPLIALSAPAGIALGTPLSTTIATGEHIDLVSGQNQQFTAGKQMNTHAGEGISNFAVKGGIKSIAHQGPHIIKAHDDVIQIAADQSVTVTSSHGNVTVAADKYVLVTAGGGFIKIANGNIQMHCPGTIDMKAGNYSLTGPDNMNYTLPVMPNDVCKPCLHNAASSGAPFAAKG